MRGVGSRGRTPINYRRRRILALAGILLLVSWIATVFILRATEIRRLRADLDRIRSEQQIALGEEEALRALLARKDDPETIEDEAREHLDLVMPGEEKVIFDRDREEPL